MHERLAIGVDFGGTTVKSAVVRGSEIITRGNTIDTQQEGRGLMDAISAEIVRLKTENTDVAAVGIGLPGIVDSINGIVHELSNVPGWIDIPLREILQKSSGLPVAIENDANAMAYGEWKFGAARDRRNVVCVTLGTGVGGGLILDGKLFRGSTLAAGEIGQMSIDYNGLPANYGNLGALEKYVGNSQIAESAHAHYRDHGKTVSLEQCTPAALSVAAQGGDEVALAMWEEIGTRIGAAFVNILWLLNPDCFVIGGGIAKAGNLLFDPICRTIETRVMDVYWKQLKIVPAELGTDAGIIGSAELGLEV